MPWQASLAAVAGEIDPETDRLAYRTVVVTVPRQSGKTTIVLSVVVHRGLGDYWWRPILGYPTYTGKRQKQNIAYAAQTGKDARKKWEDDWLPVLKETPFKNFYRVRLRNGSEAIVFKNGSLQSLMANTMASGHGGTLDLGFLDEAFAHKDARLEQSALPAMNTRPEPQLWVISTAGTPKDSPYLYGKVLAGRKLAEEQQHDLSKRRGVCYIEYSAPDDADPFDPRVWWDCMPALGYTITEDTVRGALDTMLADPKLGLNEFKRAYLNQWVLAMGDPIIPLDHWQNLSRSDALRPPWVVLGLSVAPEDAHASVVACGEDLTGLQSMVVEHGDGVDWLLPSTDDPLGALGRLVERFDRPYVLVNEKQVAHLLPEIERVVGFDRVIARKDSEIPQVCAFWLRLCKESRLTHCGEPELTVALAGAERSGGRAWRFDPVRSGVDTTPLEAQGLAASFWLGALGGDERTEG